MSARLIDGKAVAAALRAELAQNLAGLPYRPGLAVVLVGDDPASRAYVRSKDKTCSELGMHSVKYELPAFTTQETLVELVRQLNEDPSIHAILVQSPPPPHIDERAVIEAIDPRKDVDGFHPVNVGKLAIGDTDGFVPCTPLGCQRLLIEAGIETRGANIVVLGRSMIVGKPLALLLMNKGPGGDATVTVAHSRTKHLPEVCRQADILIAAIGKPEFVKADFVKDGAVVIDVGINRVAMPDGTKKTVGDVDFESAKERAAFITPVPGGVGPMTVAMLLRNTVRSAVILHGG